MKTRRLRFFSAMSLLGWATLMVLPFGCSSTGLYPRFSHTDRQQIPTITAERLQECVETYGGQLSGSDYRVHYRVEVDANGRVVDVKTTDIPDEAPDFATCTRIALRDMNVSTMPLRRTMGSTNGQTPAARGAMGDVLVVGAEITLEEVLAAAGGVNILFAISIGLAISGVTDIVEAVDEYEEIRRYCNDQRTECLGTSHGSAPGPKWKHSRCQGCYEVCMQGGAWPSRIKLGERFVSCK